MKVAFRPIGLVATVWVVKHWVKLGIYEASVHPDSDPIPDQAIYVMNPDSPLGKEYLKAGEWRLTKSEAVERAGWLRDNRVQSLRKQAARFERFDFSL